MKQFLILYFLIPIKLISQSADSIINNFKEVNAIIKNIDCTDGQLISNRAMNLFMADRVGYYLANHENLTFCKNNVTLNTGTGIFSMTHSFFEPTGADLPLKSFNALGLKANIFDAYKATKNKTTFNNELGITYKQFWLSKPKTILNNCDEKTASNSSSELIFNELKNEITLKSTNFEMELLGISNLNEKIKKELKRGFYASLNEEYSRKFATAQFRDLFENMRFKKTSMNWTNLSVFVPVIRQRYIVASDLNSNFNVKKSYPAALSINHTRFSEWKNATKVYVNLRAGLLSNNSINTTILENYTLETYRGLGGKNVSYFLDKQLDRASIGDFRNFLTPNLSAQIVYFPPQNHFGISAKLEQNFGKFKALNGTLGIPVVLIDKQSYALSNFEIQIHFFDLSNSLNYSKKLNDNISIGLTWGQAIGRNVY